MSMRESIWVASLCFRWKGPGTDSTRSCNTWTVSLTPSREWFVKRNTNFSPGIARTIGVKTSVVNLGANFTKADYEARKKNPTKQKSPIWKKFFNFKGAIKTNGKSGKDKEYYKWDYTHNDIEVYDRSGNHKGSMEPTTGKIYKDAVEGRDIKREL